MARKRNRGKKHTGRTLRQPVIRPSAGAAMRDYASRVNPPAAYN